jgi:uncharacterized protein YjcR
MVTDKAKVAAKNIIKELIDRGSFFHEYELEEVDEIAEVMAKIIDEEFKPAPYKGQK